MNKNLNFLPLLKIQNSSSPGFAFLMWMISTFPFYLRPVFSNFTQYTCSLITYNPLQIILNCLVEIFRLWHQHHLVKCVETLIAGHHWSSVRKCHFPIYLCVYIYVCVCYNPMLLLFLFLFKMSQLWSLGSSHVGSQAFSISLSTPHHCLFFFFFALSLVLSGSTRCSRFILYFPYQSCGIN